MENDEIAARFLAHLREVPSSRLFRDGRHVAGNPAPELVYDSIRRIYLIPELRDRLLAEKLRDRPRIVGEGPRPNEAVEIWQEFCRTNGLDPMQPPPERMSVSGDAC